MIHKLKSVALIFITLFLSFAIPQTQSVAKPNDTKPLSLPFPSEEELVFEAEFSKAILRGLNIAELRLKVAKQDSKTPNSENTNPVFNITAEAVSKGFAPKLFGIHFRQLVDSLVDPTNFHPVKNTKLDEQGKRVRKSETVFDNTSGKFTWSETDPNQPNKPPRIVTGDLKGYPQDLASAFYFIRLQPLKVGENFTIPLHDSGVVHDIAVKVTERKQLKTILGKVWAVKTEPDIFGKVLNGEGTVYIWFTDDARRIPIKLEVKHSIGTVNFKLKKISPK